MLSPGDRLGPYEVLAPLGAGGMGEVYRARDPRLGREVAIKVLRAEVSDDPERLRRFEREARAVAALNNPHILAVHDIGSEQGLAYVVFELLEGQTLRGLLEGGPRSARGVLDYGLQICRGLAAAHERGIVHRDLKPENVFLTEQGQVKILDFGLARRNESATGEPLTSEASTETASAPGRLVGTLGYMSPEQARGEPVDARSDLFSLGAILYELLSGRRAFTGRSSADTLAAILHSDPPEIGASASTSAPPGLESVIRRCLEKRPSDRFHSAHDLGLALETISGNRATADHPRPPRLGVSMAIGISGLLMTSVLVWWLWPGGHSGPSRASIKVTPFTSDGGAKAYPRLSPDGERVAYVWSGTSDDNWDIYIKGLGVGARPLRLTEDPADDTAPAWSPDGRYVAFVRERGDGAELYTVPSLGGPERKLTDIAHTAGAWVTWTFFRQCSVSWSPDGQWLVFSERNSKEAPPHVVRFSLATARREVLTSPSEGTFGDYCPALSPDGTELAFVRSASPEWGLKDVWLQPFPHGPARPLTHERYDWCHGLAWTPDGREVLYSHPQMTGTVGAVSRVRQTGGDPRPALGAGENALEPSVRGDRLVYVQGHWSGFTLGRVGGRHGPRADRGPQTVLRSSQRLDNPACSPDGHRIAFESESGGVSNIWVADTDGTNAVQLTSFDSAAGTPRWSPDGRRLVFDSAKAGNFDLYTVDADGGVPRQLTQKPSNENAGTWSRDGRFIYFMSDRSGSPQIWKMPAEGGPAVQVTRHGGFYGEESWDGRFLYYSPSGAAPDGIWRVPVTGGRETEILEGEIGWRNWALAREGLYVAKTRSLATRRSEEYTIERIDLASGKVTVEFREAGPLIHQNLSVCPDEQWMFYRADPAWQSELMLVENFR